LTEAVPARPRAGQHFRLMTLALVAAVTVADSVRWLRVVHPDWLIARAAGRTLLSGDGLSTYRLHPTAQMGPLALALAQLPRLAYVVLTAGALGLCLYWLTDAAVPDPATWSGPRLLMLAAGGVLVVAPWAQLAWKGHADDALVLLGGALAARSWVRRRTVAGLVGIGIAVAGKPTGLALLPFALTSPLEGAAALTLTAAIWGPFLLAQPTALLHAGKGIMPVAPGSLPAYLGLPNHSAAPSWVRGAELIAGLASSTVGVLRRHPLEGLLLGFTVRALIEPNPAPAYSIPLVVIAVAVDLRYRIPWTLPPAAASFWLSQPVLDGGPGWFRLTALAMLGVACLALLNSARRRDSTPDIRASPGFAVGRVNEVG
jgi:hypothetical protein